MKKIILVSLMYVVSLCVFAQEKNSSDWSYYLNNLWVNFEENLFSKPETLEELFKFYEKVKDNPFEVGNLEEDINTVFSGRGWDGKDLYDSYGNLYILNGLDSKEDSFIGNVYKVATTLYNNAHNINFDSLTYNALIAFLTHSVNETELYSQIAHYYWRGDKNIVHKLYFENPFIKEEYKPVLKYNEKEVEGILGRRADISYTIDYNDWKDLPIQFVNLAIDFMGNQWSHYDYRGVDKKMEGNFPAILIGKNHYYLCSVYWEGIRHPAEYKQIRTFDTHLDKISSVEITSTDTFLDNYQVTWEPPAWSF